MTAPIRAGDLRQRVKFQSRSAVKDTVGGQSTVWSDVATVWANIQPLSGREKMSAEAIHSSVSHQIIIRYQSIFADPKAVAAMRVVLVKDGVQRLFNIQDSRDDDERKRFIIMNAEEGMNDG